MTAPDRLGVDLFPLNAPPKLTPLRELRLSFVGLLKLCEDLDESLRRDR